MTRERRPCACRSMVEADPGNVEQAVIDHQRLPEHREWATLEQLRGNFVAPQPMAKSPVGNVFPLLRRTA